jgi:hypothetical protein
LYNCFSCVHLNRLKEICKLKNKYIYKDFYSKIHKKSSKIYKFPENCRDYEERLLFWKVLDEDDGYQD